MRYQPAPLPVEPGPLDVLDAAFAALVTGPEPLALHGAALGRGLPIPLGALTSVLVHPATGCAAREAVRVELVAGRDRGRASGAARRAPGGGRRHVRHSQRSGQPRPSRTTLLPLSSWSHSWAGPSSRHVDHDRLDDQAARTQRGAPQLGVLRSQAIRAPGTRAERFASRSAGCTSSPGGGGPRPGRGEPDQHPALAFHRRPVVRPVGMLAGDLAVVVDERFHGVGQ